MDAVNCSCVVSAHFGSHQVHLVVKFPAQYPNNAAPTFQFVSPTTIPSAIRNKIQKVPKQQMPQSVHSDVTEKYGGQCFDMVIVKNLWLGLQQACEEWWQVYNLIILIS